MLAAAPEVANSPSGCASCCIAEGLIPKGNDVYGGSNQRRVPRHEFAADRTFCPISLPVVSTRETFRKIRGQILYLLYAETLSLSLMIGLLYHLLCTQRY